MKTINETFEDKDFEAMREMKGKLSWHNFIILMFLHCEEAIKKGDLKIAK